MSNLVFYRGYWLGTSLIEFATHCNRKKGILKVLVFKEKKI